MKREKQGTKGKISGNWSEGTREKGRTEAKEEGKGSEGREVVSKIEIQVCCREISLPESLEVGTWPSPSSGWDAVAIVSSTGHGAWWKVEGWATMARYRWEER